MKTDNSNLNQYWAELIIEELVRNGVTYICIAPGSRSAPLVVAAARHAGVQTFLAYDERSLGFHALGVARATNRPAAIITTSGTAVANLYPAVVEAASDAVPMMILTADRPPELIDTGANQTIRQDRFFGDYVRWHFDLPCPDQAVSPSMVLTTIDQAVYRSVSDLPGPVHLNCRYREPLEPSGCSVPSGYDLVIENWKTSRVPFTRYAMAKQTLPPAGISTLTSIVENIDRGMIVAGQLSTQIQANAVLSLAQKTQWPVYADISSQLRFSGAATHPIRYYDQELLSEEFNKLAKPDVVLHFGSRTTSKRLWQYFDQNRPQRYVVIKQTPTRHDPAHYVTDHVQADIVDVCQTLSEQIAGNSTNKFADFFGDKSKKIEAVIHETIAQTDAMTEPFISRTVSELIPESSCLFLSNSMPVRDMDLYAKSIEKSIKVATNRGVSGIDGILSTAAGFAAGHEKMLTLVTGDIAMLHDLNALSVLNKLKVPMIIVVINNQGGGIFDFLPVSQHPDVFESHFVVPHEYRFKGVSETFKIPYVAAGDKQTFAESYQAATTEKTTTLIEVFTGREDNLKLRKQIKHKILEVLQQDND